MINFDRSFLVMVKQGKDFEEFVHYVYSKLISLDDPNTLVTKNTSIRGRSGSKHEFDVYYEFVKAGVKHKVAIECKDYSNAVSKGKVTEFHGKINDVDNVAGVMVAKSGYQSGAKEYANHYGIVLLTEKDLPTLPQVLALQLKNTLLPDEYIIGQPFWTLMEIKDDEVTGSYTCLPDTNVKGQKVIPLFFSKRVAQSFCSYLDPKNSVVRGVNQQQLKALIVMAEQFNISFVYFIIEPAEGETDWMALTLSIEELKSNYLLIS
jgi:hypothetical protein